MRMRCITSRCTRCVNWGGGLAARCCESGNADNVREKTRTATIAFMAVSSCQRPVKLLPVGLLYVLSWIKCDPFIDRGAQPPSAATHSLDRRYHNWQDHVTPPRLWLVRTARKDRRWQTFLQWPGGFLLGASSALGSSGSHFACHSIRIIAFTPPPIPQHQRSFPPARGTAPSAGVCPDSPG